MRQQLAHPPAGLHRVGTPRRWGEVLSPATLVRTLWACRGLVWQFAWRDVQARHRGSALGLAWTLLQPLLMLGVYTFVFAVVWEARWSEGGGTGTGGDAHATVVFALTLFCGIILFDVFAAPVNNATTSIVNQPNLVKKVVFPLEAVPLAQVVAGVVLLGVNVLVLLVANLLLRATVSATLWALPLVVLPVVLLSAGISLLVAALGVFLRDMRPVVLLLVQVLFFMTPILYPAERLAQAPAWAREVLSLNPLAPVFESARSVLVFGRMPDWAGLGIATLAGVIVLQAGFAVFIKSKRGFADVL